MEMLLGVRENANSRRRLPDTEVDPLRRDVDEADTLDQEEGRLQARHRYQHMYWESIPEGESVSAAVFDRSPERSSDIPSDAGTCLTETSSTDAREGTQS
jgi:hypothetical protein